MGVFEKSISNALEFTWSVVTSSFIYTATTQKPTPEPAKGFCTQILP